MISPTLSKKALYKIRKLFPIKQESKLFLPIIINPRNLEKIGGESPQITHWVERSAIESIMNYQNINVHPNLL